MDEFTRKELEKRNQRIIDAVIQKSKKVCPDSVALIGICGSFCSGDIHDKSDVDLLIVINDDSGWKIASCFILGEVAHDIYCTPWSKLEEMAEYEQPYIVKLMDMKTVYYADEKYLERFNELSKKVKQKIGEPFSMDDFKKAEKYLDAAAKEYVTVMISDDIGACRYASAGMINNIEYTIYMLNKTYIKRGIKRVPEEISTLKKLPEGFMEYYQSVFHADTISGIQHNSTLLIKTVKKYFDKVKKELEAPKRTLTSKDLDGSYEEIYSNWRNKMYHAADCDDTYLSFMTTASCQFFYDEMYDEFEMERINLVKDFRPDDLKYSAQAFDKAMDKYRKEYDKLSKPVRYYATIEEFEKDYLG